jgi:hypothetical protein
MKQYVVDQLRYHDYEKLKGYLDQRFGPAEMGNVFWIPLPTGRLAPVQAEHLECQPFFAAIELLEDRLCLELLVRTRQRIRCDCIAYATETQRNDLIRMVDDMLAELEITT